MKLLRCTLCGLAVLIAAAGQLPAQTSTAASSSSNSNSTVAFSERHPRYVLERGDIFDIAFEYTPEYNQTVTVQPDGYVSLRNVGDLFVAGLNIPEVNARLVEVYSKILNKPVISIVLKDFEKPYFIADGQVGHPGKYELRGDTTVVQAIAMAGGFLTSAKHSNVVLFRRVSDEWVESKLLDVKKMQNSKNLAEDVHLRPGDMVFVPKNKISKIQPYLPTTSINMIPWRF